MKWNDAKKVDAVLIGAGDVVIGPRSEYFLTPKTGGVWTNSLVWHQDRFQQDVPVMSIGFTKTKTFGFPNRFAQFVLN